MKKIIFLLSVICLYHSLRGAQLTGTVVATRTHKPLIGATVYIPDLKTGAVTDASGHYKMNNLSSGIYLVEVSYTGYDTHSEKIRIQGVIHKDWQLSASVVEGHEVVVTGVSRATEIRRQPSHISVIDYKKLQQTPADNIIGKIADMPGVNAITTGPDVMKPVIRGLSYNRVVVVNNGVRQEDQQWGDEHGVEIDSYTAGKIEVLRGASSLMYGSDALGGVINILPPEPVSEGHIKAHIIGNYQTNNGMAVYHGDISGNQKGFIWNAYVTGKLAHDYKNKYDGYVFNSKFREESFGGSIGMNKDWGYSHLFFSSYHLQLGLPEGERDSLSGKFLKDIALDDHTVEEVIAHHDDFMSYYPMIGRQTVRHRKLTWDNKISIGGGNLAVTLGYQQDHRKEFGEVLAPRDPDLYLKLNTLNYNIRYSLPDAGGWETTVGVNGMQQENKIAGTEVLIPAYHLLDVGLFGITQKTINRFSITGGLRYDIRWLHSEGLTEGNKVHFQKFNRNFSSFSGSAGVSYSAGKHFILKANMARGFRAPSIPELAANGVHEGTVRYELGNVDLKPETSTELDLGFAYRSTHVSASLYGYYNAIQHYIYSRKLLGADGKDSIRLTNEGRFRTYQFAPTDAHLYGLEASVDLHPHPLDWLHFKNTFSFVRGINIHGADSTRNLPMIPAARWLTELGFHFFHTGNTFKHVYLTFQLDNTFAQNHFFSAYGTETGTPAHTLLGVEAGTDVLNKKGKTLFSIYLSGENLTNVAYQEHLSRFKYLPMNYKTGREGIFNMGRNFSFKIVVPLDIR